MMAPVVLRIRIYGGHIAGFNFVRKARDVAYVEGYDEAVAIASTRMA